MDDLKFQTKEYFATEWNVKEGTRTDRKKVHIDNSSLSAEKVAEKYYQTAFDVYNVEPNDKLSKLPDNIDAKLNPLIENRYIPTGFPDLILYHKEEEEIVLVEVKDEGDSFRYSQFEKMFDLDCSYFVCWITSESIEKEFYRCNDCGATFEVEESYNNHNCGVESSVSRLIDKNGYGFH